jgi:hypothetical protein
MAKRVRRLTNYGAKLRRNLLHPARRHESNTLRCIPGTHISLRYPWRKLAGRLARWVRPARNFIPRKADESGQRTGRRMHEGGEDLVRVRDALGEFPLAFSLHGELRRLNQPRLHSWGSAAYQRRGVNFLDVHCAVVNLRHNFSHDREIVLPGLVACLEHV